MAKKGFGDLIEEAEEQNLIAQEIAQVKNEVKYDKIMGDITPIVASMEKSYESLRIATTACDGVNSKLTAVRQSLDEYVRTIARLHEQLNATFEKGITSRLDDHSEAQLRRAYEAANRDAKSLWTSFAESQDAWMTRHEAEIKRIIGETHKSGVWMSNRVFWLCVAIFSLLLFFFGMTIFLNIMELHESQLTKLLWIFGGLMFTAIILVCRFGEKD
jgi:hypothetical protein